MDVCIYSAEKAIINLFLALWLDPFNSWIKGTIAEYYLVKKQKGGGDGGRHWFIDLCVGDLLIPTPKKPTSLCANATKGSPAFSFTASPESRPPILRAGSLAFLLCDRCANITCKSWADRKKEKKNRNEKKLFTGRQHIFFLLANEKYAEGRAVQHLRPARKRTGKWYHMYERKITNIVNAIR